MTSKKLVVAVAVVILVLAAAFVYRAGETTKVSTSEFSEVDDVLSDLESFLDLENQEYDFNMEELYTGWS